MHTPEATPATMGTQPPPLMCGTAPSAVLSEVLVSKEDQKPFSKSMLCIQDELSHLSIQGSRESPPPYSPPLNDPDGLARALSPTPGISNAPVPEACSDSSGPSVEYYDPMIRPGFFDGLIGCLRPVWTIIGKATTNELKGEAEQWEIEFNCISDLTWLGAGAQGAVFRGQLRNELVAVKKVREQKETEIKHLRKLNHPNIVKFMGVCTAAPCYCIVMEYCPYGPLFNLLKEGEEIPPNRLINWAEQIADGMHYLHNNKIIHRDLKSPNVLIGKDEVIKISDFGTCRQWNDKSTKMSFAGTVSWMAPEVIRNEICNEKVDVWSYGVLLWELLTCEVPYKDMDSSAIMWGVGSNTLSLPIPESCPGGFRLLIRQCWSAKPRNRPSFKQILIHLRIASATWKEEVRLHMKKIKSDGSQMLQAQQALEAELVAKRQQELEHARDIRKHYERQLQLANELYLDMKAMSQQLKQQESALSEREKRCCCHKPPKKRFPRTLLKAQEHFNRRRMSHSSNTTTSPDLPSTSPDSPQKVLVTASPAKSNLYTELDASQLPQSIVRESASRPRRARHHRRSGSQGSGTVVSCSPGKDRKMTVQHVDCETQTEQVEMDISDETDTSPSSHYASRRFLPPCAVEQNQQQQQQQNRAQSPGGESLNGNTVVASTVEEEEEEEPPIMFDDDANSNLAPTGETETEDQLATLESKVTEILNGNSGEEKTIVPMRKRSRPDLKRPRRNKMQDSSDTIDSQDSVGSSREDVCEEWSEEEGSVYSDNLGRRPIAPCRQRRAILRVSLGCASEDNEENTSEYSHDPCSLRSTLESNPDLAQQVQTLGATSEIELRPGGKYRMRLKEVSLPPTWSKPLDYANSSESDSDEPSSTVASQFTQIGRQQSPRHEVPSHARQGDWYD
ncbi:hypothetical protein B566_EDAN014697 [Ephemera danica]|nr:hypothetical protein B566_EDAN014697 [Ephemera danica]